MKVAAIAGLVAAIAAGASAEVWALQGISVTASSPAERIVGPKIDLLQAPVRVTCSDQCRVTADGVVTVERAQERDLELDLLPARASATEESLVLRPRLSGESTALLQEALDSRGTTAVVDFEVSASDSPGSETQATSQTSLLAGFDILGRDVAPRLAFFDAKREPRLRFRFRSPGATDLRVQLRRGEGGRVLRKWDLESAQPFDLQKVEWGGLNRRGDAAPDGTYSFHVGLAGKPTARAGSFKLRGHVFPVAGPHGTRGAIGEFGAPRSGGGTHEGFDITADCGTPLVAARGGEVAKRFFDPVLYGWVVDIRARKSKRRFFYSHLREKPPVAKGERVRTGQKVGEVGQTGNAATTPCHLHFELRKGGEPKDPEQELRRWDRWS